MMNPQSDAVSACAHPQEGYRDGTDEGKTQTVQQGFDKGAGAASVHCVNAACLMTSHHCAEDVCSAESRSLTHGAAGFQEGAVDGRAQGRQKGLAQTLQGVAPKPLSS